MMYEIQNVILFNDNGITLLDWNARKDEEFHNWEIIYELENEIEENEIGISQIDYIVTLIEHHKC